tara:strand:+ start:816 stop:1016 length:201 start_codon:yes stop_codon:yes gene_type:complete
MGNITEKGVAKMDCAICKAGIQPDPISGWKEGHNAWPLADGRCCDNCNNTVVGARILMLKEAMDNE